MEKNVGIRTLRGLLIGVALLLVSGDVVPAESENEQADVILERALDRAKLSGKVAESGNLRWKGERTSTQYNGDGEIKEQEVEVFRVLPVAGDLFEKVVERNGRPLDAREREKQEQRQREFREKGGEGGESDREQVEFDRELIDRFVFEVAGTQHWRDRPVWVLTFEPRDGDLPNKRRIDTALNNSHGKLLIDRETYEVARVEFELMRPIRIWWGIIGRLSQVSGIIEREPVAEQAWLPTNVDIYFKGRILFKSLHRRIQTEYSDFEMTQ